MKTPFITLKNIKVDLIDNKYNFCDIYKHKSSSKPNTSAGKTKLSDIKIEDNNCTYSYIDNSKKKHLCVFTMKDSLSNETLPKSTTIKCFWCKNSFQTIPLGAPIEYIPSRLYKNYLNELTKTNYLFHESITNNETIPSSFSMNNHHLEKETLNYYLSDGVFCSFNCTKAFIIDNKSDHLYSNSINLLNKIYVDLFPDIVSNQHSFHIPAAPHWRLLRDYGGHLSIDEFRQSFFNILFCPDESSITKLPSFQSLGYIFEKKIKI